MPARRPKQSLASHERRHESGLIAPGKKVVKTKSNFQLSGNANGGPPSPNIQDLTHQGKPHTTGTDLGLEDDAYGFNDVDAMDSSSRSDSDGCGRGSSAWEKTKGSPDKHADPNSTTNGVLHMSNGTSGNHEQHVAPSLHDSVTTIIGPHYRWDVLAILLLLLQLPPVFQVLVQLGFAYMTFGNPTSSWAPTSLASTPDWFRSHGGNPSAVVSLLADIGFFCLWLLMPFMKDFVLDLAPAIVAISLGGGTAGGASWTHAGLCTGTVFVEHIFKDGRRRQFLFNLVLACMSRMSLSSKIPEPSILPPSTQASRTWARIVLELHIVTHGCVRVIRRWLETSARQPGRRDHSRPDSESVSPVNGAASVVSTDTTAEGARNGSTDGRPPGPSPAARDKATSSGKKRRKQATFVRSQQPFWAAIAYARVNLSKEIEQSHAARDSFESGAKDQHHIGDARFNCLEDRAWITNVEDTEIWFSAVLLKIQNEDEQLEPTPERERRGSLGSKFVNVRVNGAFWSSVDCTDWPYSEDQPDRDRVDGKIFGLTPFASYTVEVTRVSDHSVVYAGNVLTRPVDSPDRTTVASTQPADTLRPLSPTTTLKKSIATAEGKLSEHKHRSNKARKAHQTATRNLRQEVTDLTKNLQSSGTDERQRQRQFQYRQNIKQAEETTLELEARLANMGEVPKDEQQEYEAIKSRYDAAVERHEGVLRFLEATRKESQKAINDAQGENAKARGKREKAESRLSALTDRRKLTAEENDAKRNAKAMSEGQHANRVEYHRNQERDLIKKLQACTNQRHEMEARMAELRQHFYYDGPYTHSFNGQPSLTHTPESSYASISTGARAPPGLGFQNPIGTPAFHSRQNSVRNRNRPRSSSMLSDISGLTDDETLFNNTAGDGGIPRHSSAGSGKGSQRDQNNPTSPPPPKLSPIGTEVGRGSPRAAKR